LNKFKKKNIDKLYKMSEVFENGNAIENTDVKQEKKKKEETP